MVFALQAGDGIYDNYMICRYTSFIYANLFFYFYLWFAITMIQNLFMVIVEDSFVSVKYAKNFEWLDPNE